MVTTYKPFGKGALYESNTEVFHINQTQKGQRGDTQQHKERDKDVDEIHFDRIVFYYITVYSHTAGKIYSRISCGCLEAIKQAVKSSGAGLRSDLSVDYALC